jgi:hypothetical protein
MSYSTYIFNAHRFINIHKLTFSDRKFSVSHTKSEAEISVGNEITGRHVMKRNEISFFKQSKFHETSNCFILEHSMPPSHLLTQHEMHF